MTDAAAPDARRAFAPKIFGIPLFMIGFAAMMIGNFMALLDIQIVASSIGAIQAGLSASRDEISWVQTAYLIAEVVGIPLCGFLAKALGTRRLFCLSALLFTIASLLCSFAWDISSLVVFRAMQGFCGAAMIPTTMATLYLVIPQRSQAMAAAMVGMVVTLAPSLGPSFGGYIAEVLGWRALFWINVVPGLLVMSGVWFALGEVDKSDIRILKKLDVVGLAGLAMMLGAAEYVLEEGPSSDWFASGDIIFWAVFSAVGACIFFWRSTSVATPIVDLRPFKYLTFSIAAGLAFVLGIGLFASVFLMPVFLANVRGYNPLQIGHTMFVQGTVMFFAAPTLGMFTRGLRDTRLTGFIGFLLIALSCYFQAKLTAESGLESLWLPQAIRALGLMMTFSSIMQPALQSLPHELVHTGSGLFSTIRNLGGAFGIASLTTLQFHAYALHRQELYSAANPNNPHIQEMIQGSAAYLAQAGAADPERQALMRYASLLDREALVMTFNDQFMFLAVIIGLSSFAMFLLRPPKWRAGQARDLQQAAAH